MAIYIKLLRKDENHHGYQYTTGFHVLPESESFNSVAECGSGGFYVCERKDVANWLNLYDDLEWYREATIPEDAKKVVLEDKVKTDKLVLGERHPISDLNLGMEDIKQNVWALRFVKEQTTELCLAAVQKYGVALRYVKEQTPEICLAAVKEHGMALCYVKEQTPEICLAAVQKNGLALYYVKEQTPELCLAAIKQYGEALRYVKEQTPELCLAAVQQNGWALCYVKEKTPEVCLAAYR